MCTAQVRAGIPKVFGLDGARALLQDPRDHQGGGEAEICGATPAASRSHRGRVTNGFEPNMSVDSTLAP